MSENGKRRGPVLIEMGTPEEPPRRSPGPVLDAPVMPETPPRPDEAARMDAPRQDERARRAPREAGGDIPSPADAPMIDDGLQAVLPEPRTMQLVQRLVGKGPSPMTRFFINTGVALFTFLLSVSALRYLSNLMNTYPLLGFVGFALMVLDATRAAPGAVVIWGAVLVTSLIAIYGYARAGSLVFWKAYETGPVKAVIPANGAPLWARIPTKLETHEQIQDLGDAASPTLAFVAVWALLAGLVALTVFAGPAMQFAEATAAQLHDPAGYLSAVLQAQEGTK